MKNILRTIMLTMLMVAAQWVAGQEYEIDRVCVGAERHYRIDGEIGSVYTWLLTDPSNTVITLPSVVDTVTIIWSAPTAPVTGRYYLTNIQLGANGCDTLQLGYIDVFDVPAAFAGNNLTLCAPEPILLDLATAANYSDLIWTTSGDGSFDDATLLNATYTLGANDITNGSVILTLTAEGLGNDGSCTPAVSSITITINSLLADIDITPATCNGIADGAVTFVASGGTEPYTYDLDGNINATGVFTGLAAGTYTYIISDAAGCEITGEVTITTPDAILATLTQTNINCFGSTNGSIQITDVTGGSGDYEYRINGGVWQTGTAFTDLAPGTYVVEARDVNAPDCIVELGTITITEPEILAANTSHTDVTYFGDDDGSIIVSDATGGSGAYEYSIDGINWQSSPIFPNLPPGTYIVYIRDVNAPDCFLDIKEIIVLEGLAIEVLVDNQVSCFGGNDGQATVTATFGLEPYTYLWSDGQTTATAINLAAGTYTVTVTDADGTEITETITITEPDELLVSVTGTNPTTPGGSDGTATATVSGGTPPYTYLWDDLLAQTTQTATGLVAGTYNVIVTDANGCEVTGSITLTDPAIALALTVVVDNDVTCFGGNDGQATATATGGVLPYTYLWSDPFAQTTATATGLAAGTYTVTVTDADGTEITETITITQPDELLVSVTGTNPTTPGGNDGTATATVSGGTPPYIYLWDDLLAQTTQTATGLVAGTYNVTVTDDNGCEISGSVVLSDPDALTADVNVIHISCYGNSDGRITITNPQGGSGSYQYSIDGGLTWQNSGFYTNLPTGIYEIMIRDAFNTTNEVTLIIITITEPEELITQIDPLSSEICLNETVQFTSATSGGTGVLTHLWTGSGAVYLSATDVADPVFTGTAAGIFNLVYTVTDENDCFATEETEIIVTDVVVPAFVQIGPLCQNSTAPDLPLISLEGITGIWTPAIINTSVAGTFTFTFTPDAGQCGVETTMEIEVTDEIVPTFVQIGPLCQNSTAPDLPLISLEGITGIWTPATINTAVAGFFTFSFTPDAGQCGVETTMEIEVTDEIVPTFVQIGPLCQNSTAPDLPLISLEGITGIWTPATINTAVAGIFTFTFTPDAGQCGVETTLEIEVTDEIVPTFTQIGPLCQNSTAPALPATSIEGITGTWNPSVINTSVIGSSTYTFTPDAGQCALTTTMEIEVTNEIVPEFIAIGPLCLDSDAPELPLISENGISGTWTPATINTSVAGITTYTFTPYADQCAVQTVMIVSVSSPSIIALDLEPTTFWLPNGSAIIIADGTAVPLVYSITGNGSDWQAGNEFNNLAAGPYVAWVMDANGCMDSLSFEILNRVEGDVILAADTVSYCMNIPVIIPVDGNNFTEISSFYIELEFDPSLMSFNSIVQVHPALAGGTFSPAIVGNILQIRYSIFAGSATVPTGESLFSLNFDALQPGLTEMRWNLLSCEIFESSGQQVPGIYVNGQAEIYPAPTIYAFGSGEYCEGDSLTLQVGTSSAEQLSWVWTGPTGHQHFDPEWQLGSLGMNDNGQFTVVATNPYFCSDTKTVDLLVNPKPIIYLGYADTICYGQAAILDPGSGFVSYLWHDGSTNQTMFAIDPGLYFVSVMDEKGCSAVDSVALVPCIIDLLIPNAFTPNSDGLNDIFRPIFRGWEPSKYYMQVYSRWGQLIFESTAFQIGWDGTVDGVMAPPGVYTYVISFEAPSYVTRIVSSPVTGSVTLIR